MPDKPIQTAICSFGMSGRVFHAPFIHVSTHYDFSAVLERSKNEARKLYPNVRVYRSIGEMLKDDSIELVIVNTPNFTHYKFAADALNAGKHVVVEKPFTITAREGLRLLRLAEKKDRTLTVYHNRRYDSDFRTISKLLKKNTLGELAEMEMRFDRFKLHPGNKMHKETPGPGTGNLYDLGSHLIDQALQLFGMPKQIFADIDILRKESRVADYFELILFYEKFRVRIHSTYLALSELPGYVIFGTKGSFVKAKTNIQEDRLSAGELPDALGWGIEPAKQHGVLTTMRGNQKEEKIIVSEKGNYMDFYDQLYRAIRKQKNEPVSAMDGIRVVHLIELAYKSARLQKVVTVNDLFKNGQPE